MGLWRRKMSEKVIFLQKILDFVKSSLYLHSRKAIKPIGKCLPRW